MFNIGSKEIIIIALIILFLFGSKKLTEWARGIGEAGRELKKAKKEFGNAWDETDKDIKKTLDINEEIKPDKLLAKPEQEKSEGEKSKNEDI